MALIPVGNLSIDVAVERTTGKYIVTDNVSSLRGKGDTVEEAIGQYFFKAFCGVPLSKTSINPGIYQTSLGCKHEWQTVYEYNGGRDERCVKCQDMRTIYDGITRVNPKGVIR